LSLLAAACHSVPERWPAHELKLVVQAAPGGISDTVSRVMSALVEREIGVPVICENKPGAAGALAFSYVVRRPPDGYTIGHAPVEIAMVRSLGYADVGPEGMELLCMVSKAPPALVVRAASSWRTFPEFAEAARRDRGRIIVANSGTGSIWHFNAMLLEEMCGFRVVHVPFGGSSASITALLGGHVDAIVAGAGEVISNVRSGQLRPLAVLDAERSKIFPGTPSMTELGYQPGAPAWSGFYTPRGVDETRLQALEAAFRKAFESPEFEKLCEDRGMEPAYLGRQEFRRFALQQAEFFGTKIPRLLRLER
jgi:tripartite-type tricarboxylate transporter receptor subunit TctC